MQRRKKVRNYELPGAYRLQEIFLTFILVAFFKNHLAPQLIVNK